MVRLALLLILFVFSHYSYSNSYKYQTISFDPLNKGSLVNSVVEFDLNYQVATCKQQKEILGMSECKGPIPVIRIQDYVDDVYICDKELLKMICLVHNNFSFSFPLDNRLSENSWIFNEVDYKVIDSSFELEIFGMSINSYIIHAKGKNSETIFFFSKKMGLLAYAYPREQNGEKLLKTYYLSSEKGFGHEQSGSAGRTKLSD